VCYEEFIEVLRLGFDIIYIFWFWLVASVVCSMSMVLLCLSCDICSASDSIESIIPITAIESPAVNILLSRCISLGTGVKMKWGYTYRCG